MSYYSKTNTQNATTNPYYPDPYAPQVDAYGRPIPPAAYPPAPQVDAYGRPIPPAAPQVDAYGRPIPPAEAYPPPAPQVDAYGRPIPPASSKGSYYTPPAKGRGAVSHSVAPQAQVAPAYPQAQEPAGQLASQQVSKTGFPYFSEGELLQDLPGCHAKMNAAIKATLKNFPNEDPMWHEVDKLDIIFALRRNNDLLAKNLPPKPLTQSTTPGTRGNFKEYRESNGIYLRQFGYDNEYVNAFNQLGLNGATAKTFEGTNTVSDNLSLGDESYGANDLVPAKVVPTTDPSLDPKPKMSEHEIVLGGNVEEPKPTTSSSGKVEPSIEAASLACDFSFIPDNIEEMVVIPDEEAEDIPRCIASGVFIDMRTGETREEKAAALGIPLSAYNYILREADENTANDKRNIGINKKFSHHFIKVFNRIMDEVRVLKGEAPYTPPAKPKVNEVGYEDIKEELLGEMREAFKQLQDDTSAEVDRLSNLNKTLMERLDKAVAIVTDMKEAFEEAKEIIKAGNVSDGTESEDTGFTVVDDKVTVNEYQRRRYTMIKALPQTEDSTTLITTKSKEPKVEGILGLIKCMSEDYDTLSLDFREYLEDALIPLRKEKSLKEFLSTISDDMLEELRLVLDNNVTIECNDNDDLFCTIFRRNVLMVTQDKSLVGQVYEMKQGKLNELSNPIAKFIKATVGEKGEQLMNYGPIVLYIGQHKCIVNLSMTGSTIVRTK